MGGREHGAWLAPFWTFWSKHVDALERHLERWNTFPPLGKERQDMSRREQATKSTTAADGERAVLAKIAEMPEPDRTMGERLHAIVKASAPNLEPRLWYGMPAYAKDGKVVCFFQSGQKFKTRYSTLGFSDASNLDEGTMWPVAFALKQLTAAEEARIGALVKKAL
jgi:hypothetical protein